MKDTDLSVIPDWLCDSGLEAREFRVYCHIARFSECDRPLKEMASTCRIRRDNVQRAIKVLIHRGFITQVKRPGFTNLLRANTPDWGCT